MLLNQTFPPLQVTAASNQIVLSWPTSAFGFQLETTTDCAATNSWSAVGKAATVTGTQNVLTNAMDAGPRFYRLRKWAAENTARPAASESGVARRWTRIDADTERNEEEV